MRYFLIICALILAVLFLTSCATAEVPDRVANTYTVAGKVYCDTAVFSNIENILVSWLQATIAPTWQPICEGRE